MEREDDRTIDRAADERLTSEPETQADRHPPGEPRTTAEPTEPDPGATDRSGGAIEGADRAALGIAEPPPGAPPGASVDASERTVPGAHFERPLTEAKPWFTSLAAESDQAGVANEEPREADSD